METDENPFAVKETLLRPIEHQLGRRRADDKYAPRTIDLDLVLYDDLAIDDGDVKLPHPDLRRPFVCIPVIELLAAMPAETSGGLPDRIRALLPKTTSEADAGEKLETFTAQLQKMLCP